MAFRAAWRGGCPCCAALPAMALAAAADVDVHAVDTHSHLHVGAGAGPSGVALYSVAVLAVDERCWDDVSDYCALRCYAIPGFGVHPWRVHELEPGWQARLAARLAQHPGALCGEIGLCKCAKNLRGPGTKARVWPLQVDAFLQQLAIAARLQRPAS
eukprot:4853810-Prymnesium_polylepis.1